MPLNVKIVKWKPVKLRGILDQKVQEVIEPVLDDFCARIKDILVANVFNSLPVKQVDAPVVKTIDPIKYIDSLSVRKSKNEGRIRFTIGVDPDEMIGDISSVTIAAILEIGSARYGVAPTYAVRRTRYSLENSTADLCRQMKSKVDAVVERFFD